MDADALPDELPPLADPGGVSMPSEPPLEPPPSTALASVPARPPIPQTDIAQLSSELAGLQRQKIGANERIYGDMESTLRRDQARVEEAYRQTGIGPNDLKPWDADKAREQFRYDPIEAFGSIGSVFAMVASAFTNRPMENAMFGAAAAMQAVKDGKKEDFDRSYKSWQDNTKLALDRHKIQQERYKDSITLMQTDLSAGQARMQVNAARFGDRQALFLLENGMNKELFELMDKRQSMAIKLEEALPKIAIENEKMSAIMDATQGMQRGSPEYNAIVQKITQSFSGHATLGGANAVELDRRTAEIMEAAKAGGKEITYTQARNQAAADISGAKSTNPEIQYMTQWQAEYAAKNDGRQPTAAEKLEATKLYREARRKEDTRTEGINQILDKSKGPDGQPTVSMAEATRQFNLQAKLPNFTLPEQRRIASVPTLMRHLQTLDWFAEQTGPVRFVPQHIAAVYGGFNDPQQIYETALKAAKAATADLGSGGATLKTALLARMDRLPGNFQDARFNKRLTQELMRDTSSEASTMLSLMEKGGKALPPSALDEYVKLGIYPDSMAKQNPVTLLRTDSTALSDDQVLDIRRLSSSLSQEDRLLLRKEILRRKALEGAQ